MRRRLLLGCLPLAALAAFAALVVGTWPPLLNGVQDALLPGSERHDAEGLDPRFAVDVAELIARLDARGHGTFVRAGLRDAERQEAFVALGFSETRRSAHLRGQAVDLVATVPLAWITRHVAYFRALREEAAALGLRSGGTWSRRGVWAFFDLGWDPAHVQAGRCP